MTYLSTQCEEEPYSSEHLALLLVASNCRKCSIINFFLFNEALHLGMLIVLNLEDFFKRTFHLAHY